PILAQPGCPRHCRPTDCLVDTPFPTLKLLSDTFALGLFSALYIRIEVVCQHSKEFVLERFTHFYTQTCSSVYFWTLHQLCFSNSNHFCIHTLDFTSTYTFFLRSTFSSSFRSLSRVPFHQRLLHGYRAPGTLDNNTSQHG